MAKKKWGVSKNIIKLKENREAYSNEWDRNSYKLYENNYYKWMCNEIDSKKHVLEIGTGIGYSTLLLLKSGHSVIGIDENIECLKKTKNLLETNGYEVKYISREKIRVLNDGYELLYDKIENKIESYQALLIEGDILNDDRLFDWISENYSFDATICWLIGTYEYRHANKYINNANIYSSGDYREKVHKKLSELSCSILNEDGVLNIVDRAPKQSIDMFEYGGKKYYKSIIGKEYDIISNNFIQCNDALVDGGVKMVTAEVDESLNPSNIEVLNRDEKYSDIYLLSLILKRQK